MVKMNRIDQVLSNRVAFRTYAEYNVSVDVTISIVSFVFNDHQIG